MRTKKVYPLSKNRNFEKALNEIKKSGTIRQELIGEPLIDAKENEILGKEMNVDK